MIRRLRGVRAGAGRRFGRSSVDRFLEAREVARLEDLLEFSRPFRRRRAGGSGGKQQPGGAERRSERTPAEGSRYAAPAPARAQVPESRYTIEG